MNDCRNTAFCFLPNGKKPLAGTAASATKLTKNNACAIVAGKLVVSGSLEEKPETCAPDFFHPKKFTAATPYRHHSISIAQWRKSSGSAQQIFYAMLSHDGKNPIR